MPENNYITSVCVIRDNSVFKNKKNIFENKAAFNDFLLSIYNQFEFNYPKFYKMDNLSKLGWLASEILLQNSFQKENYKPEEVGIVLANANSSLDVDLKYFESTKEFASPSMFVYTLPNIVMGEICIRNKFKGENAFFIQKKFDPEFVQQYINNLINNNILQACICGWVDVVQEKYEAILFLVEKISKENSTLFTAENMRTYNR